jgi:23S rRNA G2445 N2-methylase RlmL
MVGRDALFATCARGLEESLEAELVDLGLARVERRAGGVAFQGSRQDVWRVNLRSALAIRVLQQVAQFQASDAERLREGVARVDWRRFVRPDGTLSVRAHARDSALDHTLFVAQCAKDGIVDRLRADTGTRPDVDKDDPQLRVVVHLSGDRCRVAVDTTGDSLHLRGWRRYQGRAPLAETLAAGLLRLSGWDRRAPLLDPFSGSGTLLVEAALWAAGAAPNALRERFAFERLPDHDAAAFEAFRAPLRASIDLPRKLRLWGGDLEARHVEGARENLAALGLAERVELEVADARDFAPRPGWNAWVVSNLPYGERVGDSRAVEELLADFGGVLRERCAGYRAALLCGSPAHAARLALPGAERRDFDNGGLAVSLVTAAL